LSRRWTVFFSEISASLYAWDVADEGIGRILDNLQEMTRCNSVYLIGLMHYEKRPLTDFFYPHNPVRKSYCPEDSRAYWRPEMVRYGRIKPITSERDFLKDRDWLQAVIDAVRLRGMRTGVEVSHTIVDGERAAGELADCIQRNIYGERIGKLVCPNNADVREYVRALFADLAANYDVDYIQTCLIPFKSGSDPGQPAARVLAAVLGGCWCDSCAAAADRAGLDWDSLRSELMPLADVLARGGPEGARERRLLGSCNTTETAVLLQTPALYEWLRFRVNSMTSFFALIHDEVHAVRDGIDLRLNAYISSCQELSGLDLRALSAHLDSVRSSDYSEQKGNMDALEHKRRWLLAVRQAIGEEMHFLSAIGVRPRATREIIRQGVVVSAQCGADGITMGHYDGAPFSNLRAIREGLELADVEFRQP
jgi:hypothetical protein